MERKTKTALRERRGERACSDCGLPVELAGYARRTTMVRQTAIQERKGRVGGRPQGSLFTSPLFPTEWRAPRQHEHLLKQHVGLSPLWLDTQLRHKIATVKRHLETIHPNPGPRRGWRRYRSGEQRRERMHRKYRRREKREQSSTAASLCNKERRHHHECVVFPSENRTDDGSGECYR